MLKPDAAYMNLADFIVSNHSAPKPLGITVFAIMPGQDVRLGIAYCKEAWDGLLDAAKKMDAYGVSNHGRGTKNPISGEMGNSAEERAYLRDYLWG